MTQGNINKFFNLEPVSECENAPMIGLKKFPGLTITSAYYFARSTV